MDSEGKPLTRQKSERNPEFIARILAFYPHWKEPLDEAVRQREPDNPDSFKAGILINWLAGDGTPEPPAPKPPPRKVKREVSYTLDELLTIGEQPKKRFPVGTTEARAPYTVGGMPQ